jgi:type IV secretion system protein TrbL
MSVHALPTGVCDVPEISGVCNLVTDPIGSMFSGPFVWLADAIGDAAKWMVEAVWSVFESTTLIDVTDERYIGIYNILFGVAIFVVMIFFLLQLITGMIRRDPTALTNALVGLARAVLGSFIVITLTATALEIVDQLCIGIVQAAGSSVAEMGTQLTVLIGGLTVFAAGSPGMAAIIVIFLGGLAIAAVAIVWLSLLVRKALLLVAIVLAPLALSGTVWEHTKGWASKWVSFVLALILSKLIVVVIFLVATTQVSAPIDFDLGLSAIADPLAGIVLLALAGFAPYLAFKFIGFIGFDLYHTMSAEQEAKSALDRPLPIPRFSAGQKGILDAASSRGSGGHGAGAAVATKAPAATSSSAAAGGASAGGASAGAGAAGAGAAAAPVAAALVAGQVVGGAATAGPKAGRSVAAVAERPSDPTPPPVRK